MRTSVRSTEQFRKLFANHDIIANRRRIGSVAFDIPCQDSEIFRKKWSGAASGDSKNSKQDFHVESKETEAQKGEIIVFQLGQTEKRFIPTAMGHVDSVE
jgi:hypothetical protein